MTKITFALFVLLYSIPSFVPVCHASKNLALGKPYTVSPLPSYSLSASPTDRTSLTDGKYTVGLFWTQKTTVGWHPIKSVEILIDLEKVAIIDGISFSTARGQHAGVIYPAHISAFVGVDKEHFLYVGDIADTPENKPGEYQTKRFLLDGIGAKGRYVLLEIIAPKSNSVFCDEIEVLGGPQENGKTGSLTLESARTMSEQMRRLDIKKELLTWLVEKFTSTSGVLAERLPKIKQTISTLATRKAAEALEADIFNLRGESLRVQFPGQKLLVEEVDTWRPISPVSPPSGIPMQSLSLLVPLRGSWHAAFILTNLLPDSQNISFSLSKTPESSPELLLYHVPFVQSAAMEYVADPLVPLTGAMTLRPGESRMMFLTAFGKEPGIWQGALTVMSDKSFSQVIPFELFVSRIAMPIKQTLNSLNWDLDFDLIKNHKPWAINDLFNHHTNVLVVPPAYLQGANQIKPVDLTRLGPYLKQHKGIAKILLGIGMGDSKNKTVAVGHPFMSEVWQANFKAWYEAAEKIVGVAGFYPKQLYIFPYDEMEGSQVDDFINLSIWAKKEIPGIQFYATINQTESLRALPYLDIVQLSNREEILTKADRYLTEKWIYGTHKPAKSGSSYSYYRLMAWKAFRDNYRGIGFWAYADAAGSAWDDFDGEYPDYAVIYEGPNNTIISSRRWEAWRTGIEDYEMLTMYAKAKGDAAAKALAKAVMDNPDDASKADEVRRKILLELSR